MAGELNELRQRKLNIARQKSEIKGLKAEISRMQKAIDSELARKFLPKLDANRPDKPCFYCGEAVSAKAKVCFHCKRVFLETAVEVFEMEKMIIEASRNERG